MKIIVNERFVTVTDKDVINKLTKQYKASLKTLKIKKDKDDLKKLLDDSIKEIEDFSVKIRVPTSRDLSKLSVDSKDRFDMEEQMFVLYVDSWEGFLDINDKVVECNEIMKKAFIEFNSALADTILACATEKFLDYKKK